MQKAPDNLLMAPDNLKRLPVHSYTATNTWANN